MDVTYAWNGVLQTHDLSALHFPLRISSDSATPGQPQSAPIIRLHRAPQAAADSAVTSADITVASSSRILELYVQAWGDSAPSYAQTLRGTPDPDAPPCTDADGPTCGGAVGDKASQAFVVRIPASQAYPDWHVLQLRFASARGAAGGVCTVYDIRTVFSPTATSAGAASGARSAAPSDVACGASTSGSAAAAVAVATLAPDVVAMAPSAAPIAAWDQTAARRPRPETARILDAAFAAGGAECNVPAGDAAAGGGPSAGTAAWDGPREPSAAGSQMQQLRELLQRAAAAEPPPPPSFHIEASAAASGASHGAHGSSSAAVPSAARANLGFATALARSLLQAQLPPAGPQPPIFQGPGAATPAPTGLGSLQWPWAHTAAPAAGSGAPDASAAAVPVSGPGFAGSGWGRTSPPSPSPSPPPPPQPSQSQPSQSQPSQSQPSQPQLRMGGTFAAPPPAAAGGGGRGGTPAFPLAGLLPGPLAAAAGQLADVCAGVRRIEHLLLQQGGGSREGGGGPPAGSNGAAAPDAVVEGKAGLSPGQRPCLLREQRQLPPPPQQQQMPDVPALPYLLGPQGEARALYPSPASPPPPPPPSLLPPTSDSVLAPLAEQLLAVVPALAAGMSRLEAAVARQSEVLTELTQRVAEVQRRMDDGAKVALHESGAFEGPKGPQFLEPVAAETPTWVGEGPKRLDGAPHSK